MIDDAVSAFLQITADSRKDRRMFSQKIAVAVGAEIAPAPTDMTVHNLMVTLFPARMFRCNRELTYPDWLINGVFPEILFQEYGREFNRIWDDPRWNAEPCYSKRDGWSSFFSRAMRLRPELGGKSFLPYLLDRLAYSRGARAMPHFYFDVESPAWVFAPLVANPRLLKTYRTALACVMAFSFRYDNAEERLHMDMICRSTQWSHIYGDLMGGYLALNAVLRDTNLPAGILTIYTPSLIMDRPKLAKMLLEYVG